MKFKTTMKKVKEENNNIIEIGYCDALTLLCCNDPIAYTCGVYGWNSDIYKINNAVISTGYRPFGNIKPSKELINRYEQKAKKTLKNDGLNYKEKQNRINFLLNEFINMVIEEAAQC